MSIPDFFQDRLNGMIDLRHPLTALATRMPWAQIEVSVAPYLQRKPWSGRHAQVNDLFGATQEVVGAGLSPVGCPRLPIRLMVPLLYLNQAYP